MELQLIVLLVSCFSLLMPPASGSLAVAKPSAANAVKGASLIGAGLALKRKAGLLASQDLVQLALRRAAIKALLANAAAHHADVGAVMLQRPVFYPVFPPNMVMVRPGPNLFDILSGIWTVIRNKVVIAKQIMENMNCPPVVGCVSRPNFYPMPMMTCLNQFKRK